MGDQKDFSQSKTTTTVTLLIGNIILYCLLLAYAMYIIVKYLVMQDKAEIVNLTVFYVLAVFLAIFRIGFMIVVWTEYETAF